MFYSGDFFRFAFKCLENRFTEDSVGLSRDQINN